MGGGGVTGTPGTLPSCALPPVLWCCVVYTNKTYSTDGLHVKIFANHRSSITKIFPKNSFESTTTYTLQTCDIAWFTSPRLLELMACVRGAATTPILVSTTPSGTVPFSPPAITCDTCLADGRDKFARNLAA